MAMELARRTERFDSYRGGYCDNLRDSEKWLKNADLEITSPAQKVSTLEWESQWGA